jgi:hypothetical protein
MTDYGAYGMPKLVVLAGATHSVCYNQNDNSIVENDVQAAVALALGSMTSVREDSDAINNVKILPNPAESKLQFQFNSEGSTYYTAEVVNVLGRTCMSFTAHSVTGENANSVDVSDLPNGVYFLKITDKTQRDLIKFIIAH